MIRMASLGAFSCVLLCAQVSWGQKPETPGRPDQSEVLRTYTELVQTDVMVFDGQGRFVDGLKPEDFELRIDGKVKPIEFFEKVTAGSISEESQLAAARGASSRLQNTKLTGPIPLDRGRPVFFYIDDLHLNQSSLPIMRSVINHFIDDEMGQNDEAAIASASGQVGFLQQLTDNKTVLRAALARLKVRPYAVRDSERPLMTEYQAMLFENRDPDVREYFISETIRNNPGMTVDMATAMVTSRATALLQQAAYITTNTLSGLEELVKGAKVLPGRKLVFFISNGFFLDRRNSDATYRLQRIASAAAKSSVVIYSMDARGLVASLSDSSESQWDPRGQLQRASMGELPASQDGLTALASNTGGRAFFNTNSLEPGLGRALKESSSYYLLAWKPEHETKSASRFRRIEVKLTGKRDLTVQVRRGFFDAEPEQTVETNKPSKPVEKIPKSPASEVQKLIKSSFPDRGIPVSVNLSYLNTPKGLFLTALMHIPREFVSFEESNGKHVALIDIGGVFLNDRGQVGADFNNRVTVNAASLEAAHNGSDISYSHAVLLQPGLYQVRVAARDEKNGRAGSAHAWIEIPNLSSGQLALSSVLLGARAELSNAAARDQKSSESIQLIAAHHFSPNDHLQFLVFVYNATPKNPDGQPDLAIQVQLVRDKQPVVTTALKKISTEGILDLARLPYAAEIPLAGLPAGHYILQLTVVDRVAKRSASQQTRLEIE